MVTVFILLVLFQIKHFVADYPLQNSYMLKKFLPGGEYILPLLAHSLVHAYGTLVISLAFVSPEVACALAVADLMIHFMMDRIKASPAMLGRYKALSANDFKKLMQDRSELIKLGAPAHELNEIDRRLKENTYFWWSLGLDQGVHHLTHYAIIAVIVGVS